MYRKKLNRKYSKKLFRKKSWTNKKNNSRPMRGGIRM